MANVKFDYALTGDARGLQSSVSVFADYEHIRSEWCEDADLAGLRLAHIGGFDALGDDTAMGDILPMGDVVLADCPVASGKVLALLSRIDSRVAQSGAQLVVSTSAAALDDIFACLSQSNPHILVDPTRDERILALGHVIMEKPRARLRDLTQEDRIALLRLTERIGEIADRLDRMGAQGLGADGSAFRFESPSDGFKGEDEREQTLVRKPRPPLPDPRLMREIIRRRRARETFFDSELFADPAWDMLLDLAAARAEHKRVSVTSLCIASGVPATTALRWIAQMTEMGLFERQEDDTDRRRVFIALSDKAADAMARYFAEVGPGLSQPV